MFSGAPPALFILLEIYYKMAPLTARRRRRVSEVFESMRRVRTLGLLGTGVIGGGWAARALHFGIDVLAADVKPEMEAWIRGAVENAECTLVRLTSAPLPPKGELSFTTDMAAMARQSDFIQENVPEQLELKRRVLAEVSRHVPADVVIASSTSGIMASDLQRDMRFPERFLVAHPFNPVYLLPLVELVGGRATSQQALESAAAFFSYIGMHPLRVRSEVPGHLTDRLQEALWREILHLVNDGVATTGELDEAIVYGPGLRWAGMGTNLIYHLAGGETGMRHMLRQFGPCLKWPWTKLEAPELTEQLIDRMVEGTQAQAGGRSIRELERLRDEYLVSVQQVLKQYDIGAGATLRALEERLYADSAERLIRTVTAADPHAGQPLETLQTQVRTDWIDHSGRMAEARCLQIFADAADALFRMVGVNGVDRAAARAFFAHESHVIHHAPAGALETLRVLTQVLGVDDNGVHLFHALKRRSDGRLIATGEQLYEYVNAAGGAAAPMDPAVRAQLQRIRAKHAKLPVPVHAGRHVVFGRD